MILLYTGAQSPNAPQINANNSLGGYVSISSVPNGRLANIFSTIAKSDVLAGRQAIRMVALKNTTGTTVNGVSIYSNVAGGHVKLQIAAVAPITDANGNPVFESIFDGSTLPYQASLDYHEGVENAISAGSIANGAVIGIWILREVDQTTFPEFSTTATGQALADILTASAPVAGESVGLVISWT